MNQQLSLLELLERPTVEALVKPDQIFSSDDWNFVCQLPESTHLDRKSARVAPSGLAEYLSSFGNGPAVEGAVLLIGIENDGTITGCKGQSKEKIQQLEYMGRDQCPLGRFQTNKLKVVNKDGEDDFIIRSRIYFVEDKLVELTNGTAYCRESDRNRRLNESEKSEIRINKGERAFELEACNLKYPNDFQDDLLTRFANLIRQRREGSDLVTKEEILASMRLGKIQNGEFIPNNVCALTFASDPQQVFPGSYIHFLRFEGVQEKSGKEYNVRKDRIIDGTILDIIKNAASTLDANLREFTEYKNGKFSQIPEYPRDAWYELIVNACVHRSYHSKTQPIFVKMFDDHLIVESPGGFMPSITPEHLVHKPRNPFLMFVLREFGEVRCISEGTKRIKQELRAARLPNIKYESSHNSVTAVIYNDAANRTNSLDSEAYKVLGEALSFSLDTEERKLVNYVIEHKKINASQALRILSTTYWHTANAKLRRLVDRGILEFVSQKQRDPKSHYVLRNPSDASSSEKKASTIRKMHSKRKGKDSSSR